MKTVTEQIADLENTRAAKAARMSAIMQKSMDENRSTDTAEAEEFDGIAAELKTIDADLVRLKQLETMMAQKATPVNGQTSLHASQSREGVTVKNTQKLEPGMEFTRYAIAIAAGRGNLMQSLEVAKSRFPDSDRVVNTIKAAVAAGTTTDPTWAAPLVEYQNFAGDFVEFLRPQTILGRFGQNGIPALRRIPFNVRIAGQTSGGNGYWVGEGAPKPLTKFDFNATELGFAKVANIAVLTEELIRLSTPSAEGIVRQALADALIARLDTDFVDPAKAAVAGVSPASITNGVTAIVPTGTGDIDDIRADLRALWAGYIAANVNPSSAVFIMSATRALALSLMTNALGQPEFTNLGMNGGTLNGVPVIVSEYVDAGTVILVNASDVWLADDGQVAVDASREASLQMLDNPTNDSGDATATTMVSMFQTNSVALRAERWINWAKRRAGAAAIITNAAWGEA